MLYIVCAHVYTLEVDLETRDTAAALRLELWATVKASSAFGVELIDLILR